MIPELIKEIDFTTAAGWLTAIALVIYLKWDDIKYALGRLYQDRHADSADRRESMQDLSRVELESNLQERATMAGMQWYERKAAIDILRDQLAHSRDDFSDLQAGQDQIKVDFIRHDEHVRNRLARIEARLDNFLMLLSKLSDRIP